jgi:integrase
MGQRVKEKNIATRDARGKLAVQGKPYFRFLAPEVHLGYRKGTKARRWVARVYVDGRYLTKNIGHADDLVAADGHTTLNFGQAEAKAREWQRLLTTGSASVPGKHTAREAIDAYIAYLGDRPAAASVKCRLAKCVPAELGAKHISKLTDTELRAWHQALATEPPRTSGGPREVDFSDADVVRKRKASANMLLTYLKCALNHAVATKKAARSDADAWHLVKPFKGVNAARVRYLSIAEGQRLVNACDPIFRPLLQAALLTGCRYAEITRLQVQDYNSDTGRLRIVKTKSGHPRHVILTDEGAAFFASVCAGRKGSDFMFTNHVGKQWQPNQQGKWMRLACKNGNVEPISIHGMRHTYASRSIMAGADRMAIARNLGHTDTRMIDKHYGHLDEDFIAKEIRSKAPTFGFENASKVRAIR